MNMSRICQSCGMYIESPNQQGTNNDNSKSGDYCIYCFKNGAFLFADTMEEKVEKCLEFYIDENTDENLARKKLLKLFPTLKRWKK